jgi:hypothetical protein
MACGPPVSMLDCYDIVRKFTTARCLEPSGSVQEGILPNLLAHFPLGGLDFLQLVNRKAVQRERRHAAWQEGRRQLRQEPLSRGFGPLRSLAGRSALDEISPSPGGAFQRLALASLDLFEGRPRT